MTSFKCILFSLMTLLSFSGNLFAQQQPFNESNYLSMWWGTITGEKQARILRIQKLTKGGDNRYKIDAVYGFPDKQTPIGVGADNAEIVVSPEGVRLNFVTQANTNIQTIQTSPTVFEGTFVLKNGAKQTIRLEKITEAELAAKIAMENNPFKMPPGSDVPANCAVWFGLWGGKWSIGNTGEGRLWVTNVDAGCKVRYAYVTRTLTEIPNGAMKSGEVKDSTLSFTCGDSGTCEFQHKGNSLWVNYNNPSGGRNQAVFNKMN